MTNDRLREVAERWDAVGAVLRRAVAHAETTARHFRAAEVPRGCAHAFAAEGELRAAWREIGELSELHAKRSRADP